MGGVIERWMNRRQEGRKKEGREGGREEGRTGKLALIFKNLGSSQCIASASVVTLKIDQSTQTRKWKEKKTIHMKLQANQLLFLIICHRSPLLPFPITIITSEMTTVCLPGTSLIHCWDLPGKTGTALSLATVSTGTCTGSTKLLKEKKNQSRLEAENAHTAQWAKLHARVTRTANSSNDNRLQPPRPADNTVPLWATWVSWDLITLILHGCSDRELIWQRISGPETNCPWK